MTTRPHKVLAAHQQALEDSARQAVNVVELTGTLSLARRSSTKQGKPMAKILVRPFARAGTSLVPFTAWGPIAEEICTWPIGTPVRVTGLIRAWQPQTAGPNTWYVDLHVATAEKA
jgi:hypothetical protein